VPAYEIVESGGDFDAGIIAALILIGGGLLEAGARQQLGYGGRYTPFTSQPENPWGW
jgi:hypothetical protein